jgi:predicted transcriptional regulator of viral defense system
MLSCVLSYNKSCSRGLKSVSTIADSLQVLKNKGARHLSHNSPQIFCILNEVSKSTVFLGAFPKLRKVAANFVMYVYPSVRVEQLGPHWTDFQEILRVYVAKSVQKIQDSLKSDKNKRYFK